MQNCHLEHIQELQTVGIQDRQEALALAYIDEAPILAKHR
jgi:hypothetical protein